MAMGLNPGHVPPPHKVIKLLYIIHRAATQKLYIFQVLSPDHCMTQSQVSIPLTSLFICHVHFINGGKLESTILG